MQWYQRESSLWSSAVKRLAGSARRVLVADARCLHRARTSGGHRLPAAFRRLLDALRRINRAAAAAYPGGRVLNVECGRNSAPPPVAGMCSGGKFRCMTRCGSCRGVAFLNRTGCGKMWTTSARLHDCAAKHRSKSAVGNHTWIEVSHGAGEGIETSAAWFYVGTGSGLWVNTGRSAVYEGHSAAMRDLLNVTCREWGPGNNRVVNRSCMPHFPALFAEAARRNYTTVQFLRHCDMPGGCVAIELALSPFLARLRVSLASAAVWAARFALRLRQLVLAHELQRPFCGSCDAKKTFGPLASSHLCDCRSRRGGEGLVAAPA